MPLSSNLNDLFLGLINSNRPVNLFNVLSSIEGKNNVVLSDDWQIFKENNDTILFNQIIEEQGSSTSLESAISYLLESESIYSTILSDYMIKRKHSCNNKYSFITQHGYNLKDLKQESCLHREQEQEIIKICLHRDHKNNIMLIGDSGVGKTFLIASIAHLLNLDIYYIDISSVLAGSKYRGEFEKKFHAILNEALQHKKILFFDEAHTIFNTGNSDGGISGADILKPYLMNNNFQIIGATTIDESKFFSHDKAFERRFNFVQMQELTVEKTKDIVKSKFKQTMGWDQQVFDQIFLYLDDNFMNRNYPDKALDFFDFYFAGEKLSFFNINDIKKVFNFFTRMNTVSL